MTALLAVLCACAHVHLVGAYDGIIDGGVSDLNTKIVVFVDRMIALADKPEGTYDANVAFYAEAKGNIATLTLRAGVEENNQTTEKMLQELSGAIARLAALHQMGREQGLKKAVAEPALESIEVSIKAILKFEVAKRREQAQGN